MNANVLRGIVLALALPLAAAQEEGLSARMAAAGLVDVQSLEPSIRVELKYATTDNFMHAAVYGDLRTCYLQPEVAGMVVKAQRLLQKQHPGWALKIFDGARPRRVQKIMWAIVKGTDMQKYVTSPERGSIHNYGSAVDLTMTDAKGRELDMGTSYDFLGDLAQPRYEARFLKEGRLTAAQVQHRAWLKELMVDVGFSPIPNEWWHFDAFPRDVVQGRYQILE